MISTVSRYLLSLNSNYLKLEVFKMNGNQKICCTVESCKYNNTNEGLCTLNEIIVTPKSNCKTKKPSESKCSSYKCEE